MAEIHARMIVEVMGRPVEHVVEALQKIAGNIGNEKGVNVLSSKIREPIAVKEAKGLFTSFVEIDAHFDSLVHYFRVLFTYMPSNSEIIEPESIRLGNDEINEFSNAVLARLHDYDALAKRIVSERDAAIMQLQNLNVKSDLKPIGQLLKKTNKKSKKKS
jgi:hypothetical protein